MANIKSAKKRVLIAERNRLKNVAVKSEIKTAIRKTLELAQAKNEAELKPAISHAYKLCDKAVSKGVLHKKHCCKKKIKINSCC